MIKHIKNYRITWLLVIALCSHLTSIGQSLASSRQSSYLTYIYKLNPVEVKKLLTGKMDQFPLTLTNQPIDSFPTDSLHKKQLPIGHYLFTKADKNLIKTELKSIQNIEVQIINNDRDLILFVSYKGDSLPLKNAKVTINNRRIPFNNTTNTYILRKSNKQGLLCIETENQTAFFQLKRDYNNPAAKQLLRNITHAFPVKYILYPFRRVYYSLKYKNPLFRKRYDYEEKMKGYLAFSKPKYYPQDTLKWKAFMTNKRGKPYNKSVRMVLSTYDHGYEEICDTILSFTTCGAYFHELPLGDSLKLNYNYNIELLHPRSDKLLLSNSFSLEDYQLNETTYKIRTDKLTFHRGEPINLFLSGRDANGLPLLDSRFTINMYPENINHYFVDSLFIPDLIWTTSQKLEPLGETTIKIPDSLLPSVKLSLKVEITFNNSNNESHLERLRLMYNGQENRIEYQLINDSIQAHYFEDGITKAKQGLLLVFSGTDTLENKTIQFPYKDKLNAHWTDYLFTIGDLTEKLTLYNEKSLFECFTSRSADTLHINFNNPRKLPITYSIYRKGNKIIQEGNTVFLDQKIATKGDESYFINHSYIWGGKIITDNKEIFVFNNNLQVDIDQPSQIFPGQKTEVTVKVTDFEDKPVKDVNITAMALNSQFETDNVPNVPYLGKTPKHRPYINNFSITSIGYSAQKTLNTNWLNKMRLDTIPYYQMTFPESIFFYNEEGIDISNAQFAPYLFKNGHQQPIYMIYVDNQLIYYDLSNFPGDFSFNVTPGYHNIRLRTKNSEYQLDSILIKKKSKLDFSLNVDQIPQIIKVTKMPEYLNNQETKELQNSMLLLKNNFKNQWAYLWQGNRVIRFAPYQKSHALYTLGPFIYDSIHFAIADGYQTNYIFEPGYEYTIEKGLIKMVKANPFRHKIRLHSNYREKSLGQISYPTPIIYQSPKSGLNEPVFPTFPHTTSVENGTLKIDYQGDSTILLIQIKALGTGVCDRLYKNYTRTFYDLYPGWYQMFLVTSEDHALLLDSVFVLPNGINFRRISDKNLVNVPNYELSWEHKKSNLFSNQLESLFYANSIGGSSIRGKVLDENTGEPIPFANIVAYKNGIQVGGATSDFDGNYTITNLIEGLVDLKTTFVGYNILVTTNLFIKKNKVLFCDFEMESSAEMLECVEIINYCIPLISRDLTSSGATVSAEEITRMSCRSANAVATTVGGVFSQGEVLFVDGIRGIDPTLYLKTQENQHENFWTVNNFKGLRTNFNDCGYWQPNLITNEKGEATFQVTFPDDVTSWDTYALAMNGKKQTGMGRKQTLSYKPILAQLSVPRFLLQGDQAEVIGKISNHTSSSEKMMVSFEINGESVINTDTIVENSVIEYLAIKANSEDSLHLKYKIQTQNGFLDGEKRNIPIFPMGMEETRGNFYVLNGDTSIHISLIPDGNPTTIYAENNVLAPLLDELKQLEDYPYFCMEQSASKLVGLLMEQKIQQALKQPFTKERLIKKMINRLEKGQNDDGGWGWWPSSQTSIWMTNYVLNALNQAIKNGHEVNNLEPAMDYLKWNLDILEGNELLITVNALSEMKIELPYATYLKKVEDGYPTAYQKLIILKIRQTVHLDYSIEPLLAEVKQTTIGNYYWGIGEFGWYDNKNNMTVLAYQIIEQQDSLHPFLSKIRNYFLETKGHDQWQNTIDKAKILATILPGIMREYGEDITPVSLKMTGALNTTINKFPFSATIGSTGNNLQIEKSGDGCLYLTTYQKFWNSNPLATDSVFVVETWFEKDGIRIDTLKAGQPIELKVSVKAREKGDYIMVEIPIPAGCSYGNNERNKTRFEVHREYFKNKTSIFCEHLNEGNYIFTIDLQPRYSGVFTLNPAKVELMYFPTFMGNNGTRQTVITQSKVAE